MLSFSISLLYPLILYFIPGLFRIPSLKNSNECKYRISKIIQLIVWNIFYNLFVLIKFIKIVTFVSKNIFIIFLDSKIILLIWILAKNMEQVYLNDSNFLKNI